MAVYLFAFHAYRSWMPDRRQGYVRRGEGVRPTDPEMAARYEGDARHEAVVFTPEVQALLVAAAQSLCALKDWRLHQVMTDRTHVHTLLSWRGVVPWSSVRRALKYRYTSDLNGALDGSRVWFSESGSRKRVRDRRHYDFLMDAYLPKHDGVYWRDDGKTRVECRARRASDAQRPGDQNRRL